MHRQTGRPNLLSQYAAQYDTWEKLDQFRANNSHERFIAFLHTTDKIRPDSNEEITLLAYYLRTNRILFRQIYRYLMATTIEMFDINQIFNNSNHVPTLRQQILTHETAEFCEAMNQEMERKATFRINGPQHQEGMSSWKYNFDLAKAYSNNTFYILYFTLIRYLFMVINYFRGKHELEQPTIKLQRMTRLRSRLRNTHERKLEFRTNYSHRNQPGQVFLRTFSDEEATAVQEVKTALTHIIDDLEASFAQGRGPAIFTMTRHHSISIPTIVADGSIISKRILRHRDFGRRSVAGISSDMSLAVGDDELVCTAPLQPPTILLNTHNVEFSLHQLLGNDDALRVIFKNMDWHTLTSKLLVELTPHIQLIINEPESTLRTTHFSVYRNNTCIGRASISTERGVFIGLRGLQRFMISYLFTLIHKIKEIDRETYEDIYNHFAQQHLEDRLTEKLISACKQVFSRCEVDFIGMLSLSNLTYNVNLAPTPFNVARIPSSIIQERVCTLLEPTDITALAATCRHLNRAITSNNTFFFFSVVSPITRAQRLAYIQQTNVSTNRRNPFGPDTDNYFSYAEREFERAIGRAFDYNATIQGLNCLRKNTYIIREYINRVNRLGDHSRLDFSTIQLPCKIGKLIADGYMHGDQIEVNNFFKSLLNLSDFAFISTATFIVEMIKELYLRNTPIMQTKTARELVQAFLITWSLGDDNEYNHQHIVSRVPRLMRNNRWLHADAHRSVYELSLNVGAYDNRIVVINLVNSLEANVTNELHRQHQSHLARGFFARAIVAGMEALQLQPPVERIPSAPR